jgi:dATP pyrophosphohydrolase
MTKLSAKYIEVIVFKFEGDAASYLLLHRRANTTPFPGIWQIITGTLKKGEKALKGAMRELKEETGLKPESLWAVPYVDAFFEVKKDSVNFIPVFAVQVNSGAAVKISKEHDGYEWMSFEEAVKRIVWQGQRNAVEAVRNEIISGRVPMRISRI